MKMLRVYLQSISFLLLSNILPSSAAIDLVLRRSTSTRTDDYEDYWFFEIDLATKSPSRVLLKCQQYYHYYQSGAEQRNNGVFPLVVWIVLNKKREESLKYHIADEFGTRQRDIFLVITPDQLEGLITNHSV
jgi:hypothetical protein